MEVRRRLPIGVELVPGGAHARVWAPKRRRVEVVVDGARAVELAAEPGGYFAGRLDGARAGTRYAFRLDGEDRLYPDPASRAQPDGPHGPSAIVDPTAFHWTDDGWRGVTLDGLVLYELHVGTFTREGTWEAAARELPALAELGVTCVEMMPVAEFPGRFGWGYDGVDLFAPTRLYGTPDDLRRFVDRAHALGLGVILDVVYNHLGPDGNYLGCFADDYTTDRYRGEWGDPINFDGEHAGPVRELFLANAAYWIDELHLDGLRLDATQGMYDASPEHILAAIARRVREAAGGRATILVAENEPQRTELVREHGLDTMWNDDFHHSARVALTGRNEAYYSDHQGTPQELISAVRRGFLYQGQRYAWQDQRRGTPALDLPPARFVLYLQNHDQIPNASACGLRGHALTDLGRWRAMTALLLLAPGTPMLFQGQEFAASAPFLYFADHHADLEAKVRDGRAAFVRQFPSVADHERAAGLPDPGGLDTFERCKLDHGERETHAATWRLHADLLRLRREDAAFRAPVDGAVLAEEAFVLRWLTGDGDDRLLLVNLGRDLARGSFAEPLLAPPARARWAAIWSSEDPSYGGCGTPPVESDAGWRIPGHAAVVMGAAR